MTNRCLYVENGFFLILKKLDVFGKKIDILNLIQTFLLNITQMFLHRDGPGNQLFMIAKETQDHMGIIWTSKGIMHF